MKFEEAVRSCAALADAFQAGLQALKQSDKTHVNCAKPRRLAGSVDVDSTLSRDLPNANRWDYAIGISHSNNRDSVVWMEIHPASSTGEIKIVLAKLSWLKSWLTENAPELMALPGEYVWVATGAVAFPASSPQRRQLAAAGIRFAGNQYEIQAT